MDLAIVSAPQITSRSFDNGGFAAAVLDRMAEGAFALDGNWRFIVFNAACERVLGHTASQVLGRSLWEVYPEIRGSDFEQRCLAILADGHEATFEIDSITQPGLCLKLRVFPLEDGLGVLVLDVTQRRRVEADLMQALTQTEAARAWMDALLEHAPIGLAFFDREGRYIQVNRRLAEINGIPAEAHAGKHISELPPVKASGFEPALGQVLQTGDPIPTLEITGGTPAQADTERHWLTGLYPIRGRSGIDAVGAFVLDITERKLGEQQMRLLMQEVDHRAKNALAVALALLRLSRAGTQEEFAQTVEGRIGALARAHTLLAANRWQGADLRLMLEEILRPLAQHAGAVLSLEGPDLRIRSDGVQPLSLVVHELGTNALRHGALSIAAGTLDVRWHRDPSGQGLHLDWTESHGPAPVQPSRPGVGLSLTERNIRHQLHGVLTMAWPQEGVRIHLNLPRLLADPD